LCISAIRKAQGKKNPDDYSVSPPDWQAIAEDFSRDIQRALGGDPDILDDALVDARHKARIQRQSYGCP
jgi:hypothetical protein